MIAAMRRMRSLVVLAVVAGLIAGCNNRIEPPPSPPAMGSLTAPQSYTVQGTFNPELSPSHQDLVIRVDPAAKMMIVGSPGAAVIIPITSNDGFSFHAQTPVVLPLLSGVCGSNVTYSAFDFFAAKDSISGTATGIAYVQQGDVASRTNAQLDFSGVPDTTPPSILDQISPVDPLETLTFISSEPLPAGVLAQLVSPSHWVTLDSRGGGTALTTEFETVAGALHYDTPYKLVVDRWTDLAGNPGTQPNDIITSPAPPLIAADGFESTSDPMVGGARIVDATVMPPISGQKSALVGTPESIFSQGARFTVRLAVAPGNSVVRFSIRQFGGPFEPGAFSAHVRLAVPGVEIDSTLLGNLGSSTTDQVLPSGREVTAGDVVPIKAALPGGVSSEVVFDFRVGNFGESCSPPLAVPLYLIDDLRVE